MKIKSNLALTIAILILYFSLPKVDAIIEFKDGGTHYFDYSTSEYIWVDYQAPSVQTTVNILNGGYCWELDGYNNSRVNMSGGRIGYIFAWDNSQVTVMGGEIIDDIVALGNSQITYLGGTIGSFLYGEGSSKVTVSGGSIAYLAAWDNSQVYVSGGEISFLGTDNNGRLVIYGSGFNYPYGEITDFSGTLTGILLNGDAINCTFKRDENWPYGGNYGSILLVPEPATFFLLGLGAVMLRRKRS